VGGERTRAGPSGGSSPSPKTLKRLEELTAKIREHGGGNVEPMQLAALLLEKTTEQLSEDEAERLVRPKRRVSR
jgi:hypothetical protein